jgi:hypothetical protein
MTLRYDEGKESMRLTFAGVYGTVDISSQGGGSYVNENGKISLYGNVWKSFELETPYIATGNTYVAFKFELISEAEGHAICVEDDLNADTFGGFHKRCIALAGSQFDSWNINHVRKIEKAEIGDGDEEVSNILTQTVLVGDLFPEIGTEIKYISFVQDNDAALYEGVSSFWDIQLFDTLPVSVFHFPCRLQFKAALLTF